MGANHFILILSINLNIGHNSLRCNTLVTLRDIHGVSKFLGKTISFSKQCCTQMLVHSRVEEIFMFESSHGGDLHVRKQPLKGNYTQVAISNSSIMKNIGDERNDLNKDKSADEQIVRDNSNEASSASTWSL
jgi:hypothetical protein